MTTLHLRPRCLPLFHKTHTLVLLVRCTPPAARTSTAQFSSPQGSVLHPFPIYFGQSNAFSPRSRLRATLRARDRWACHRCAPFRRTVAKHGDCAAVGGRGGDVGGAARTMWRSRVSNRTCSGREGEYAFQCASEPHCRYLCTGVPYLYREPT
jgi:hypothetical protein